MPRGKRLDEKARWRIILCFKKGKGFKTIARELNVHIKTVKNIVKKFKETGTIKERARSGRSKKTTSKEDRIIVGLAKVSRRASCASIRHDFVGSSGKNISRRTINRWLTAAGLNQGEPGKSPC